MAQGEDSDESFEADGTGEPRRTDFARAVRGRRVAAEQPKARSLRSASRRGRNVGAGLQAPTSRSAGWARGRRDARNAGQTSFVLSVLAPDHTGLTLKEQPSLFWFISSDTSLPVELDYRRPERDRASPGDPHRVASQAWSAPRAAGRLRRAARPWSGLSVVGGGDTGHRPALARHPGERHHRAGRAQPASSGRSWQEPARKTSRPGTRRPGSGTTHSRRSPT